MLDVIHLDFDYPDRSILNEVTFHLSEGSLLHLRGANGSGKTTLLKLVAGLSYPEHGTILFQNKSIHADLSTYQKQLCYLGHKTGINLSLTLRENCYFDIHYGLSNQNINELAAVFHLEQYIDTPCALLSTGQRRQVGLLRLWMSQAPLWVLDEPLVALDEYSISILIKKMVQHITQGGSVIMSSHQALPLQQAIFEEYYL